MAVDQITTRSSCCSMSLRIMNSRWRWYIPSIFGSNAATRVVAAPCGNDFIGNAHFRFWSTHPAYSTKSVRFNNDNLALGKTSWNHLLRRYVSRQVRCNCTWVHAITPNTFVFQIICEIDTEKYVCCLRLPVCSSAIIRITSLNLSVPLDRFKISNTYWEVIVIEANSTLLMTRTANIHDPGIIACFQNFVQN